MIVMLTGSTNQMVSVVTNGYGTTYTAYVMYTCDPTVLVAEVTQVSLGVGYEIGRAAIMGKRTLCLYRPQPDKSKLYCSSSLVCYND